MPTSPSKIELIAQYHCKCGENPLWNDRTATLYWTDIPTRRLFKFIPASGHHEPIYSGDQQVGGFTFEADDSLLLFRERDIARMHADGSVHSIIDFHDEGVPRFNDVIAAPCGRVFAGSMGNNLRGGLYRLDHDHQLTNLWRGSNCSNGMAFTADLATLYWTCTTSRTIYALDYDPDTGSLADARPHIRLPDGPDSPVPDGITIDTADQLYVTLWGGSGINIYNPAGTQIDRIDLPVNNITSCCFGGDDLHDLYITTAGGDESAPANPAGALFRMRLKALGRPEFRSKITA